MVSFEKWSGMRRVKPSVAAMIGIGFILIGSVTGCDMLEVSSVWRQGDVVIDGKEDGNEWEYAKYVFEDEHVTLGLMNDDEYFYLCFSSGDAAAQQQLLISGCTVWLDPGEEKEKNRGIHYPLGNQRMVIQPSFDGNRPDSRPEPGAMGQILSSTSDTIEMIGLGDSDNRRMSVGEASNFGITVALGETKRILVYELMIPLSRNQYHPYAIDVTGGGFSVCLEIPRVEQMQQPGATGGGGRPGGGEMGGGMGGDSPGRNTLPMGSLMAEKLELWIHVNLAASE